MRRVVLAIGGTVAGLVVLLTFKSHTGTSAVSAAAPGGTAGAGGNATGTSSGAGTANGAGGTATSGTGSGAGGSAPSGSRTSPGTAPAQGDTAGARVITGNVASTVYGPVQVQVAVKAGKIIKVTILQQPSTTAHDLQIGAFAFPQLEAETLSAQSAKIDMVSGASYTSGGYIQSLQSAIDRGA